MKCQNCSCELPENSKFCSACNTPVAITPPQDDTSAPQTVVAAESSQNFSPNEDTQFPAAPQAADGPEAAKNSLPDESTQDFIPPQNDSEIGPKPKKKNTKLLKIIFPLAAILVVFGIVLTVVLLTRCKHEYESETVKEATCSSEGEMKYTCTLCGKTYTEAIPKNDNHSYTSKITKEATAYATGEKTFTCSLCGDTYTEEIPIIKTNWELAHYVDDFGDEGSDAYVRGSFSGRFSNSATLGSDLDVIVYLDKDVSTVEFRMFEYGSYRVDLDSHETATLKIKKSDNTTDTYSLSFDGTDLYCSSYALKNAVLENENLSCVITINSRYSSTSDVYRFETDNIGLKELYNKT